MDAIDVGFYRHQGHLTVNGVFNAAEMDAVVADIEAWGETFLAGLPKEQRAWYVDGGVQAGEGTDVNHSVLRQSDLPSRFKNHALAGALSRDAGNLLPFAVRRLKASPWSARRIA